MLSRTYETDVEMKLNIEVREISTNVKFHGNNSFCMLQSNKQLTLVVSSISIHK